MYSSIKFVSDKSPEFISWLCPRLIPKLAARDEIIYYENDHIDHVYLIPDGYAGYVLPKYNNTVYLHISPGNQFGILDIVGAVEKHGDHHCASSWYDKRKSLHRMFTV